ncbi:MAG: chemotaxis protein CheC, partial [Candidatus Nitrotoga sp.]
MTPLSELQQDALVEIFNTGTGRAAASLSQIVGHEIALSVPRIQFVPVSEISAALLLFDSLPLSMVEQTFSGPLEIKASLLFTGESAMQIVRDMMGSQLNLEELIEFEQEAMCELGNIILNACMSAMSSMLNFTLTSTLPGYSIGTRDDIAQRLMISPDEPTII